jgi:PHD/YefM family antitoxin component YafN of YafNO toxin-antitoxin module
MLKALKGVLMMTYTVTELKKDTGTVLQQMSLDHCALITQNGKPKTMLLDVENLDLESLMPELRRMRARLAVDAMRRRSSQLGNDTLTMDEVDAIIAKTRTKRASSAGRKTT